MYLRIFLSITLVAIVSATGAQEKLTITPDYPQRGQEIVVRYNPNAPGSQIPADAEKVEMVFTYSNFYEVSNKISMTKKGNVWETKIPMARYATYATFYLQSDDKRDQPAADKHFGIAVYDGRERVFNGYLYEGYSISAQTGKIPDLGARQAALFQKELVAYPENYEAKLRLLNYKISLAEGIEKERLTKEAEEIIAAKFYENPGNMGFMNKTTMGYLIIGQSTRLDSIRQVVKEKYPKTEAGYEMRISEIKREENKDKMAKQLLAFIKNEKPSNPQFLKSAHQALMEYYASKKQTKKTIHHLNKLGDDLSLYRAETFKKRAELFYRSGIALDTALSLAHRSLEIAHTYPVGLIRYFPETGHIPAFVDEITREKTTNKARGNLNTLIGLIKLKQGMPAESYITEGLQVSQDNETLANAGEYYSLTRAHQQAFDVYKKITMAVPEDTASFSKMQSAYAAWKPGLEGWEEQVSVLKTFWMEETLKQIRKEIINIATPDFASALVNLKGEPVNRESLRNKIIVLDFWATWCIPCMHEMPYLQNVYDQYKNDPDVVFMVINSGSKNTIDDARGWWGNKKFTFPVYFNNDPMIGEKLKFNVIPATYIIDKTGNIRFKTIGFEGAVIERKMKAAIQLLKEGEM